MGIETIAFIALSAASAFSKISAGKKEAKQIIKQGNIEAQEKGKEIRLRSARLQSSFLNSGLTLEGTPSNVISGSYVSGLEDIEQIRSNYGARASNAISKSRSEALGALAGSFANSAMGDMSFSNIGYGLNDPLSSNAWGQTFGAMEAGAGSNDYGPYQSPWG